MAGAYKKPSDKKRGPAGKYTIWWYGEDGRRRFGTGTTDRKKSLEIANANEAEALKIKAGILDPKERTRRQAALRPIEDHIEGYRLEVLARGGTDRHAKQVASALTRILADAEVNSVADLAPDRIQAALGRLRQKRSPRTANHALGCVKAFATWLEGANRIQEVPRALTLIEPYSEQVDRKRERRPLTRAELDKLLTTTEAGPTEYIYGPTKSKHTRIGISGPERAMLYRTAMGTGFRANELRSLVPESFTLDGDKPTIRVDAAYAKNRKTVEQPISLELSGQLRPFLADRPPGIRVFTVPDRTADILARDLERAGIPRTDAAGRVLDFHALRHSYITHLVESGVNPKVVQLLARHSTITLTLDRYCHIEDASLRDAIEGRHSGSANGES